MNFSCPTCSAKYHIADENVIGRTLKMKCRKCEAEIPIQGRAVSIIPQLSDVESVPPSSRPRLSVISSDRLRLSLPYRTGASGRPSEPPSLPPSAAEGPEQRFRVAIRGKSVGPLDRRELRDKLEEGEISEASYVWRPGMTRWTRLGEVSELAELVASLPPPSSSWLPPPSSSRLPLKSKMAEGTEQGLNSSRPALRSDDPPVVPTENRSGRYVAAIVALVSFLGLGFLLGTFIANRETQVIREVVEIPVESLPENVPPPVAVDSAESAESDRAPGADVGSRKESGEKRREASLGASSPGWRGEGAKEKTEERSVRSPGADAPDQEATGTEGAQQGGRSLSAAQIERTVARYQGGVRRRCWQPVLAGAPLGGSSTVRVEVRVSVDSSGAVTSSRAVAAPPGYSELGQCIASQIESWRFPASGGSTQVKVPFVFAAQ